MARHRKKSSGKLILFLLYIILAFYLVNLSLGLVNLPRVFSELNNWVFLIAGILLALAGFRGLFSRSRH
jgi:hypothetical protein